MAKTDKKIIYIGIGIVLAITLFYLFSGDMIKRTGQTGSEEVKMKLYLGDRDGNLILSVGPPMMAVEPRKALVEAKSKVYFLWIGLSVMNPTSKNVPLYNIGVVNDSTKTSGTLFRTEASSDWTNISSLQPTGSFTNEQVIGPMPIETLIQTEGGFGAHTFKVTLGANYPSLDPRITASSYLEYNKQLVLNIGKDTCSDTTPERQCSTVAAARGKYCTASYADDLLNCTARFGSQTPCETAGGTWNSTTLKCIGCSPILTDCADQGCRDPFTNAIVSDVNCNCNTGAGYFNVSGVCTYQDCIDGTIRGQCVPGTTNYCDPSNCVGASCGNVLENCTVCPISGQLNGCPDDSQGGDTGTCAATGLCTYPSTQAGMDINLLYS